MDGWDISGISKLVGVFAGAASFNQPLDQWDVSKVVAFYRLFDDALAFNQDISMWDISGLNIYGGCSYCFDFYDADGNYLSSGGVMEDMFDGVVLDTQYLTNMYINWSSLGVDLEGSEFDGGTGYYFEEAQSARDSLVNDYNWNISDRGVWIDNNSNGIHDYFE